MNSSIPFADEFTEKAVLGALILVPDRIGEVRQQLHERDFTNPGHRLVWRALLDLDSTRASIDIVTLRAALEASGGLGVLGGLDALVEIEGSVTSAAALTSQCRILADHSAKRRVFELCGRTRAQIADVRPGLGEVTPFLEQLETDLFEISSRKFDTEKVEPLALSLSSVVDPLRDLAPVGGLMTELDGLDDILHGLRAGDLCILAARPGRGKTLVATQIVLNVAKAGNPVLFVSLEMKTRQLVERLLCNLGGIDSNVMRDRRFAAPQNRTALDHAAACLEQIGQHTTIVDKTGVTIDQLRAIARRARSHGGLKLIVVDYLQLMRAPGEAARWLEVARISAGLKALAMEFEVPIIALSQLKREATAKPRPDLSDLRESASIEQDADVVILLSDGEMVGPDTMELVADVAKNRHGRIDDARIEVEKRYFRAFDRRFKAEVVFDSSGGGA